MSTAPTPPGTFVAPVATQETGKRRASRIPLDYFKKQTLLGRWKVWLSVLALLAFGGYYAWGFFLPTGEERYSRGPVTHHHANLECAACHGNFTGVTGAIFASDAKVNDQKCMACHSGPVHHPTMNSALVVGCAGCHREHRGPDASLVRLPDSDCTSCHQNLSAGMTGTQHYKNVASFADHPPFGLPQKDPGTVKFNHALHLNPGQVKNPGDRGGMTYARMKQYDPASARRYLKEGTKDEDLVTLSCGSCHQLDAGDFGFKAGEFNYEDKPAGLTEAALQPRAAGKYYQPIVYDVACKACHPLTFDPDLKDDKGMALAAPHRVQPAELKRFIEGAYLREIVKPGPSGIFAEKDRPTRPLPGKLSAEEAARVQTAVKQRTENAWKDLFEGKQTLLLNGKQTCGECHDQVKKDDQWVIPPANIPQVWQPHARFDHVAHKAVDCKSCHDKATTSTTHTDVLLPQVDNCRQCHGPLQTSGGQRQGGVRSDCTGCHSYHNGEAPLQGPGAAIRSPAEPMDVQKFLNYPRK